MDAVTLHIAKDMLLVYTVEKPEVHPHAENVWPHVCVTKHNGAWCLKPEEADTLAKNV